MKIEFDKNDLDYIDKVNEDLNEGKEIPLFIGEKGKRYFIEFVCEDVAKANAFALNLMKANAKDIEYLKDEVGIGIKCISYCSGDSKVKEIKMFLEKMLFELEEMED